MATRRNHQSTPLAIAAGLFVGLVGLILVFVLAAPARAATCAPYTPPPQAEGTVRLGSNCYEAAAGAIMVTVQTKPAPTAGFKAVIGTDAGQELVSTDIPGGMGNALVHLSLPQGVNKIRILRLEFTHDPTLPAPSADPYVIGSPAAADVLNNAAPPTPVPPTPDPGCTPPSAYPAPGENTCTAVRFASPKATKWAGDGPVTFQVKVQLSKAFDGEVRVPVSATNGATVENAIFAQGQTEVTLNVTLPANVRGTTIALGQPSVAAVVRLEGQSTMDVERERLSLPIVLR